MAAKTKSNIFPNISRISRTQRSNHCNKNLLVISKYERLFFYESVPLQIAALPFPFCVNKAAVMFTTAQLNVQNVSRHSTTEKEEIATCTTCWMKALLVHISQLKRSKIDIQTRSETTMHVLWNDTKQPKIFDIIFSN